MLKIDIIENNIYYFKVNDILIEDFNNFINYFDNVFKKKINFEIIFDLSDLTMKDLLFSKQMLHFMNKNKNNTTLYINKTAIIVNKTFAYFLNIFIFSFYKPIKPNIITDNYNDSLLFIKNIK